MPDNTVQQIRTACRKRLAHPSSREDGLETRLFNIIRANVESGRLKRLFRVDRAHRRTSANYLSLADYVDRVLLHLVKEQARVDRLAAGDQAEWERLGDFLAPRAYRACRRFRESSDAWQAAQELVVETCIIIFEHPYPFDVPFEAWATKILHNLVLTRYLRSSDALDRPRPPESLDAPPPAHGENNTTLGELIADTQSAAPFEKVENQELILQAIATLPSREQQQVILLAYIEGLDAGDIARRMRKSKQAIYNLRNRALRTLGEAAK